MRGKHGNGDGTRNGTERRRHDRGLFEAKVMVEAGGGVLAYTCENLSASGGLFVGPPRLGVGEQLRLRLPLPTRAAAEIAGEVRRATPRTDGACAYGVAFLGVPADVEDGIHNAILAALERSMGQPSEHVLVVYELELTRRALERDARALGFVPVAAASVDEALACLDDPTRDFAAVVLDGHLEAQSRVALLERLLEERPGTRRLLVTGLPHTSMPHIALASGHAHAVVEQPWTLDRLREAFGATPPPPAE